LQVQLVPQDQRERRASEIAAQIRPLLSAQPGTIVRTRITGGVRRGGGPGGQSGEDRLSVQLRGYDLPTLERLAEQCAEIIAAVDGVAGIELSQEPGTPEMVVSVDRAKATAMGLRVSEVADSLETAIGGIRASMFREQGDEYDILVRLREEDRLAVGQVADVPIILPDGQTIAAESIVRMNRQEGPFQITRMDQQRVVEVRGMIAGRDLGSIVEDAREALQAVDLPADYEIRFGGEYEQQQEAFRELTFAAILALILVYMVMASQFESLRDPFIILFSVPLAAIGVILTLVLTNTTFNIQGFLGVIVLVGVVVNNAIVLIDYTKLLRREYNYPLREAVVTAGARRLRPILMTTVTTVLGLVPMALGLGEGGEMQAPMARVVIGGMTTSTLITLVFIPVLYTVLEERTERAETATSTPRLEAVPGD
jgi:HAE1 family hydrophobic/amphiphilic exporter-1